MRNFQLAILIAFTITLFLVCSCKPRTPATLASTLPDTTGYYAARDLKGLGYFILGQSSFKETVNKIKTEIKKNPNEYWIDPLEISIWDTMTYDPNYRTPYGGHIYCPLNKNVFLHTYFIGGFELSRVFLNFYKDTLFAIEIDEPSDLSSAFNKKYGEATHLSSERSMVKKGGHNYSVTTNVYVWQNESVIATRKSVVEKEIGDKDAVGKYSEWITINLLNDSIKKESKECESKYYKLYEARKKAIEERKLDEI